MRTDKERLDFLQKLTEQGEYTGTVIMRNSTTGRGCRLNETSWPGAVADVRQAIDNFMDEEGEKITLEDCRGKLVVLNFWGPGCAPCLTELPHIQELNEQFADRGVVFISVASGGPSKRATQVLADAGVTYSTFYDRAIFEKYHVAGIPTSVLIDHVGRGMYRHVGFREGDQTRMAEELERLLAWIENA